MRTLHPSVPLYLFLAIVSACSDASSPDRHGDPATLTIVSGDRQTATVGTPLASPILIRVSDDRGRIVPGAGVSVETSSNAGSVSTPMSVSDDSGLVRIAWTLGTIASDDATIVAKLVAGNRATTTVHAAARPDTPIELRLLTAPPQGARNGEPFAQPVVVAVVDKYQNIVPAYDGTVSVRLLEETPRRTLRGPVKSVIDPSGRATFAGMAIVGEVGTATLVFDATPLTRIIAAVAVASGPPARITAIGTTTPLATVGTNGPPLAVRVVDESDNGVPSIDVRFAVVGTTNTTVVQTDPSGIARFTQWTAPPKSGVYAVVAAATGASDLTFSVDVRAAPPAQLAIVGAATLSGTAAQPGVALVVRATDEFGNGVSDARVSFALGDGTVLGGAVTESTGTARLDVWTVPRKIGAYVIRASVTGTKSADFALNVVVGPPALVEIATLPASAQVTATITIAALVTDAGGNPLGAVPVLWESVTSGLRFTSSASVADAAGIARTSVILPTTAGPTVFRARLPNNVLRSFNVVALPGPFYMLSPPYTDFTLHVGDRFSGTVQAQDQWGNGIAGYPLTTRLANGAGSITPTSQSTNAAGNATFSAIVGPLPGQQNFLIDAVNFSAWFRVLASGDRGRVVPFFGPSFTIKAGTAMVCDVIVTGADGRPVNNFLVSFSIASDQGEIVGGSTGGVWTRTFLSGRTSAEGFVAAIWQPPSTPGTYTMTVTSPAPNDVGSPIVFRATVTP